MNIYESVEFNDERPAVVSIHKTNNINYLAIGLHSGQLMKKHFTKVPTILTVLEGLISFHINEETFQLKKGDVFHIPPNIEHEVRGLDKAIFTLTQEYS